MDCRVTPHFPTSDHCIVLAELALQHGGARGTRKLFLDFGRGDFVLINSVLLSVDQEVELTNRVPIDENYNQFVTIMRAAIDDFVPRCYIARAKRAVCPRYLATLCSTKLKLWRKFRDGHDGLVWRKYRGVASKFSKKVREYAEVELPFFFQTSCCFRQAEFLVWGFHGTLEAGILW